MKVIIEWGRPKFATKRQLCGISGHFVVPSVAQARKLAAQLFHTMNEGGWPKANEGAWQITKNEPRKTLWSQDRSLWVTVSFLDNVMRGPYAGIADKESNPICGEEAAALGFSSDAQMQEHEKWLLKHGDTNYIMWLASIQSKQGAETASNKEHL